MNTQAKKELETGLAMAFGLFIGNFPVCPFVFPNLTMVSGFLTGCIAALLILIYYSFRAYRDLSRSNQE